MPAFLNRWIWLILALFLESCFFCCSIYWPIITFNPTGYIYKIRLAIIVLLSSPIFYQIVKSWCYSTAIKCFVVHELTNISKEYSQACKAIKNQDKTLIPASYQPIFSRMAFDQPDGNIQLTQINQHVVSVLQLRFNNIPITHLLKAYWKNPEVEQLKGEDTLQDETQTVSEVKETPNLSSSTPNEYEKLGNKKVRNNENTFLPAKQIIKENNQTNLSTDLNKIASAFIEYENSSNKIKNIEEFCKMKGLNKKTFRDYRKSKLKSSSLPKKKNN